MSTLALQDCCETTDWGIFRDTYKQHPDLQEYTEAVIHKRIDDATAKKAINVCFNHNQWMKAEVSSPLRTKEQKTKTGRGKDSNVAEYNLLEYSWFPFTELSNMRK